MAEAEAWRKELKNTGYEIFIGILSILSIVNLVLLYAVEDPNLTTVLRVMNALLSAIFLIDFTYRLFTTESKSRYFFRRFGWADLLASLPLRAAEDPAGLPPRSRVPAAASVRRQERCPQPGQGSGRRARSSPCS